MNETSSCDVLYLDADFVAVNKPAGLAVHRSRLVGSDDDYLVDRLRKAVDGPLYAVHRLDRATSGVMLLARSSAAAADLGRQLMDRLVEKTYIAVVRGWPAETGTIDYPLSVGGLQGEPKPAVTRWRRIAAVELPIALGRYLAQRYALLALTPETGRYRQLRRHLHHVSHPVVGDTSHGRGDHNRLWRQQFGVHRMLLHAWSLNLRHPTGGEPLRLQAPLDTAWQTALRGLGIDPESVERSLLGFEVVGEDAVAGETYRNHVVVAAAGVGPAADDR